MLPLHQGRIVSCEGWNRTNGFLVQSQAKLPTASTSQNVRRACASIELQSALRESNPPRQVGSLAPKPLGQGHTFNKLRRQESNLRQSG